LLPGWGKRSTFDGEDAGAIVASVFGAPGDAVEVERRDGYRNTLSSVPHAAAFLRVLGPGEAEATATASTVELPVTLTMRGCLVYAARGALSGGRRLRGGEHDPDLSAGEGHRLAGRGGERGAAVRAGP
jgi:hypothetical protein